MVKELFWENPYGKDFHYLCYLPKDYDASKKYPLVFFLHGAGERGNEDGSELELVYRYFWFDRARKGEDFPCIMVGPQCPREKYWGCYVESLNRFLDFVISEYAVDTDRISLTGLSMGGTGTWHWSLGNPERFAAVAPVCGTGVYWYGEKLVNKPVWAFHGDVDDIVPPEESLQMVKSINKRGGHAKLTLFHNVGHDAWVGAYKGRELLDWMMEKSL